MAGREIDREEEEEEEGGTSYSSTYLQHSESNGTNITHVLSPMTTSLVESRVEKDREEEEEQEQEGKGMYALNRENLFNIASGQLETSLYIVSEGMREYSNGGSNRKQHYLVDKRMEEEEEEPERGFSSPSSPNNSQALINHKSNLKSGVKREKRVNWPGYPPTSALRREVPPEPSCFPLFRWCLILIGLVMLTSVLVIMGQLLVDWGHGRAGGHFPNLASRQGETTTINGTETPEFLTSSTLQTNRTQA